MKSKLLKTLALSVSIITLSGALPVISSSCGNGNSPTDTYEIKGDNQITGPKTGTRLNTWTLYLNNKVVTQDVEWSFKSKTLNITYNSSTKMISWTDLSNGSYTFDLIAKHNNVSTTITITLTVSISYSVDGGSVNLIGFKGEAKTDNTPWQLLEDDQDPVTSGVSWSIEMNNQPSWLSIGQTTGVISWTDQIDRSYPTLEFYAKATYDGNSYKSRLITLNIKFSKFNFGPSDNPICLSTSTLNLNPDSVTNCTWSVDNTSIASIDQNGLLSGNGNGDITVSVSVDSETYTIPVRIRDFSASSTNFQTDLDYEAPTVIRGSQTLHGHTDKHKYDLYLPTNFDPSKPQKILLYLCGGAWCTGDKDAFVTEGKRYAAAGYIVASMNYSILDLGITDVSDLQDPTKLLAFIQLLAKNQPQDTDMFVMREEIFSCIKSIKEKLISLGCDGNKLELALTGNSAGGHLALFAGYSLTVDPSTFTDADTPSGMVTVHSSPIPIRFIFPSVAPVDFQVSTWSTGTLFSVLSSYFYSILTLGSGVTTTQTELDNNQANGRIKSVGPINYLNSNSLPTILLYGGADNIIGPAHKPLIEQTLANANVPHVIVYDPDATHNIRVDDRTNGYMKQFMEAFCDYSNKYFQL